MMQILMIETNAKRAATTMIRVLALSISASISCCSLVPNIRAMPRTSEKEFGANCRLRKISTRKQWQLDN
jgi:hypothetical protein